MNTTIEPNRNVTFSFRMVQTYNDTISGTQRTQVAYGEMDAQSKHVTLVFPETKIKCQLTKEEWKTFKRAVDDMIELSERADLA